MPRRPSAVKIKKKKPRTTEQENRMVNEKYLGKCPPPSDRAGFLTWCAYMVDTREARGWLEDYLKPSGRTARGVPDRWINTSVCYRARLKTLGAPFTAHQERLLESGISGILKHVEEAAEEDPAPKPTIADHVRERVSEVIGELEGLIDDGVPGGFSIEVWYREQEASSTVVRRAAAKLRRVLQELDEAILGKSPDLNEAYRWASRKGLRELRDTYARLVSDSERFVDNANRARAPRKPKPVSVEKKLKHLAATYLKFSKEFNVNSVDPQKVIGAQELWTLNVKYKLLTVYRAESHGGQLDVARCKVTGFNRNDSHTYRLGRKSSALVADVLKSSRAGLKKVIVDLKEAPLQERVNENTVLLRV